jgi:hypothetical protein
MLDISQVKSTNMTSRKRNPYSIEELLKKPEKRRKVEIVTEIKRDLKEESCDTNDEEPTVNVETCD